MKRSIWFWLYFILTIILAVYFATRVIMIGMGRGTLAHVRNYAIYADQSDKDLTAISASAGIVRDMRIYNPETLTQIKDRILAVPGVKDVAVRRRPNGGITIQTKLYRAVALWTDGQNYYPLADDGTIVQHPVSERTEGTVLFRGKVPNDISQITKVAQNMLGDLDYLEWIENRRWNLHTTGGITVMLPEDDPIAAIGGLIAMNQNNHILDKKITVLDMRDASRILVK